MFTRPDDLGDEQVRDALERGWGLDVVGIEHAPVGFGSHHWWVATGDGCRWFATADDLRARRLEPDEPLAAPLTRLRGALATATDLHDHGLDWVVAARRTEAGEVVVPVGEAFALSVYPRVEGRTFGWGPFDDPAHRTAVLDRLVALHTTSGCRGSAGVDDLGRALVTGLRALAADPGPEWDAGPFAHRAWRLLVERGQALRHLLDLHTQLVGVAAPDPYVLTHGEPHRGNTVVTETGVVLVDWDTCLLAPPERDLWMLAGEDPGILRRYEECTGTRPDPGLLEAYRLRWALADVAAGLRDLRGPHADDEDARTSWLALREVLERA